MNFLSSDPFDKLLFAIDVQMTDKIPKEMMIRPTARSAFPTILKIANKLKMIPIIHKIGAIILMVPPSKI